MRDCVSLLFKEHGFVTRPAGLQTRSPCEQSAVIFAVFGGEQLRDLLVRRVVEFGGLVILRGDGVPQRREEDVIATAKPAATLRYFLMQRMKGDVTTDDKSKLWARLFSGGDSAPATRHTGCG